MAGGDRPASWMKMHIFSTLMVWCILVFCRWHLRSVALKINFAQPQRSDDTSVSIISFCTDTPLCCRWGFSEKYTCISVAAGNRKKISGERTIQPDIITIFMWYLLAVSPRSLLQHSCQGKQEKTHWFYDSCKQGGEVGLLIDGDLALPFIS